MDCSNADLMFIPIVCGLSLRQQQRVELRLSCIVLYLTSLQPESVCACTSALCVFALHQRPKGTQQRPLQPESLPFFDSSLSLCLIITSPSTVFCIIMFLRWMLKRKLTSTLSWHVFFLLVFVYNFLEVHSFPDLRRQCMDLDSMTKRTPLWIQAAEINFLRLVAGWRDR